MTTSIIRDNCKRAANYYGRGIASLRKWINHADLWESQEITIASHEFSYSVFHAQCRNVRIVREVARSAP